MFVFMTRGATNFILRYADCVARMITIVSCTLCTYERFELDLLRHEFSTSRVFRNQLSVVHVFIQAKSNMLSTVLI